MPARLLHITGQVQGVFFRAHAKEMAELLRLNGWVKNLPDGTVEIHAEGDQEAIGKLEEWCHRGPPTARVETVQIREVPEEGLDAFSIVH